MAAAAAVRRAEPRRSRARLWWLKEEHAELVSQTMQCKRGVEVFVYTTSYYVSVYCSSQNVPEKTLPGLTYFTLVHTTYLQGDPTQTVKSNLALTDRKHAINFNLKVDSDQGRLGI